MALVLFSFKPSTVKRFSKCLSVLLLSTRHLPENWFNRKWESKFVRKRKRGSVTAKLTHPRLSSLSVRVRAWSTLAEHWRASSRRSPSTSFTARWSTNATRSLQTSELWRGQHLQPVKSPNCSCPTLVPKSLDHCPISFPVASWCARTWWPEESTSPMSTGCCSTIPPAVQGEPQKSSPSIFVCF